MEKFCLKEKVYNVFVLMLIFVAVFSVAYFYRNNVIYDDDMFYAFYFMNQNLFTSLDFSAIHGGGYFGLFVLQFFAFKLPLMLNIHPLDFMGSGLSCISGIFFACLMLLLAKIMCLHNKIRNIHLSTCIFFVCYYFWSMVSSRVFAFLSAYFFYRYVFSLLFLGLLVYLLYKSTVLRKKKANIYLPIMVFSSWVVGASVEYNFIAFIGFFILLLSYNLIVYVYSKFTKKEQSFNKSFIFNLNFDFFASFFAMVVTSYLFLTSFNAKIILEERGVTTATTTKVLNILPDFSRVFFEIYIRDEMVYNIIFCTILVISFVFAWKRKEIKKVLFPFFLQLSLWATTFSLIICGTEGHEGTYWITHYKCVFLYKIISLISLFLLLNYFVKRVICYLPKKGMKVVFTWIFSFLIILLGFSPYILFYNQIAISELVMKNGTLFEVKKAAYMAEKMLRFYYLQDKVPNIPLLFTIGYSIMKWTDIEYAECSDKEDHYQKAKILDYYARVYDDSTPLKLGFNVKKNALETFYADGGVFYDFELKDIKFSRLRDENFVLNKKTDLPKIKKEFTKTYYDLPHEIEDISGYFE